MSEPAPLNDTQTPNSSGVSVEDPPMWLDDVAVNVKNRQSPPNNPTEIGDKPPKWINYRYDNPEYGIDQHRLKFNSVDLGEVVCPEGMIVVGVALGPKMVSGTSASEHSDCMSIKLQCAHPTTTDNSQLYGNSQQKSPVIDSQLRALSATNQGVRDILDKLLSGKPTLKSQVDDFLSTGDQLRKEMDTIQLDSRPFGCATFEKSQSNKSISSLSFQKRKNIDADPLSYSLGFKLTWQESDATISKREDSVVAMNDPQLKDCITDPDAPLMKYPTLSTIGYYDTNIISYYGWAVTGVQLYRKYPDTVALNVRFQPVSKG